MQIKKISDHHIVQTPTCGELREILRDGEFRGLDLAVASNIKSTKAHFHRNFDEIYFVMDGSITLLTYDPNAGTKSEHILVANELCVLPRGTHHRISEASESNRLCVLSVPKWDGADEHLSDAL
jgi:mannose-6-phosphate isomerase-like protein (cupin superfamily)